MNCAPVGGGRPLEFPCVRSGQRGRRFLARTILAAALSALGPAAHAEGPLVLNTANDPPNATDDQSGICDRIMAEAFRRLGVPLRIVRLPSERALFNANEGIDDGNFARVEGLEKTYGNLTRVPEEITRFEFVAFSKDRTAAPTTWDSLRPFHVGIITGWKILETRIVGTKSLTKVRDEDLLFRLLSEGRVDVVVYDRVQGNHYLKKSGLQGIDARGRPLAVRAMYPYLHRRHGDLAPKLAAVLGEMKRDGTCDRIRWQVLRSDGGER